MRFQYSAILAMLYCITFGVQAQEDVEAINRNMGRKKKGYYYDYWQYDYGWPIYDKKGEQVYIKEKPTYVRAEPTYHYKHDDSWYHPKGFNSYPSFYHEAW